VAEFRMPSLGADMEAGTLVEWLVRPGDTVRRGDIVALVDTEKAVIEVEVFADGVVDELLVEPGARVPVGTPLANLTSPETGPTVTAVAPAAATSPTAALREPVPRPASPAVTSTAVASPLVRRLAEARGLDLASVRGTGAGGRITRADVERVAAAKPRPPGTGRPRVSPRARRMSDRHGIDPAGLRGTGPGGSVTGADVERAVPTSDASPSVPPRSPDLPAAEGRQAAMRASIARLMSRSNRDIPHFYVAQDIDLRAALRWVEDENLRRPVRERLLPAALLLKAAARAARDVAGCNGSWVDDRFVPADGVHLGVVVSLRGGGLVVPVIRDADDKSVGDLMGSLGDLIARVRKGRLRASDMTDASISVTNLGDQGVDAVYGVIHPPQVAIVGFGRVSDRPWAADGMLGVRPAVTVTLSADHRAVDGRLGALFLHAVDRLLQRPDRL
jgi:pyruvate dehydrogenase E2 component (dihydrolipoamide acetyltransferase)